VTKLPGHVNVTLDGETSIAQKTLTNVPKMLTYVDQMQIALTLQDRMSVIVTQDFNSTPTICVKVFQAIK
jgi:hypothetical protein